MVMKFSANTARRATELIQRYPRKEGAILPVLYMAQEEFGHLNTEALDYVANFMDLPPARIYGLVTFYTMLHTRPIGKYHIQVCRTLPCALAGAERLTECLKQRLGITLGETTSDGRFTLSEVECLASCGTAPVVQINDDYYENLSEDKLRNIIRHLE
jgi:NADH-quinone oxidoreductase E subunit